MIGVTDLQEDPSIKNRPVDAVWEGEGGMS